MNEKWRKVVTGLVLGGFLTSGVWFPGAVQAAQETVTASAPGRHAVHSETERLQHLAKAASVDQSTLLQYRQQGVSMRDLHKAVMLAQVSGKSLSDIMTLKQSNSDWTAVMKAIDVTPEKIRAFRQNKIAQFMAPKVNMKPEHFSALLQDGYRPHDVAMAALLAQEAGKNLADVLNMKKINNKWRDVASELNIDQATYQAKAKLLHPGFPHHHGHGPALNQ